MSNEYCSDDSGMLSKASLSSLLSIGAWTSKALFADNNSKSSVDASAITSTRESGNAISSAHGRPTTLLKEFRRTS